MQVELADAEKVFHYNFIYMSDFKKQSEDELLEEVTSSEYKYGFTTDIETIKAPKGLNEEVIKFISNIKKEPDWML